MLAAWKTALGRNRHLNNARQERRVEKALMLIELLEDKEAHVYSMRLLLTSNASWDAVKARAYQLSAFGNEPPVFKVKRLGNLFNRLAVASVTIELHVLTYATNGWVRQLGQMSPRMLHYCADLRQKQLLVCSAPMAKRLPLCSERGPTHEEFEDTWKSKYVEAQSAVSFRGDEVPVAALSRKVRMVRLPWMRGTIRYDAVRDEMYKAVATYMEDVKGGWKLKRTSQVGSG